MTANPAAYPATVTPMFQYHQGLDPVRARVTAGQQLTNDQVIQAVEAARHTSRRFASAARHPRSPPRRRPLLVTCVGGASLLIIVATT